MLLSVLSFAQKTESSLPMPAETPNDPLPSSPSPSTFGAPKDPLPSPGAAPKDPLPLPASDPVKTSSGSLIGT